MSLPTLAKPTELGSEYKEYATKGMVAYRAPSLLQPHRGRQAIRDAHEGKIPVLTAFFVGLSSLEVTKVASVLGFDFVCIDWEHSNMNTETMTACVQAIAHLSEGKSAACVRVPGHDHASIGFALDAGASLLIVPQVDTVEQAKHICSATKFGKKINGTRSAPPCRWPPGFSTGLLDPKLTFWENQNLQAGIIIQIESLEGMHNLDAILTEVGDQIDSVWLGSLDARASMSLPEFWGEEKEWIDAVDVFLAAMKKHDKPYSGLAIGPDEARQKMATGRTFIGSATDFYSIISQVAEIETTRRLFPTTNFSALNKS